MTSETPTVETTTRSVELHGAHSCLIDQFSWDATNVKRSPSRSRLRIDLDS